MTLFLKKKIRVKLSQNNPIIYDFYDMDSKVNGYILLFLKVDKKLLNNFLGSFSLSIVRRGK